MHDFISQSRGAFWVEQHVVLHLWFVVCLLKKSKVCILNCRALPPSITGLTALRALYSEENRLDAEVPEGPYLRLVA